MTTIVKQMLNKKRTMTIRTVEKTADVGSKFGAGDEIRTRDFLLGKQTFYR